MVKKVTDETKRAILNKSAFALPDRPSEAGIPATTVKKAFYAPITDSTDSVLSEIDRVVDEVNQSLETGGVEVDTTPTEGSGKPVTSGGVYTAIQDSIAEAEAYADEKATEAVGTARTYTDSQNTVVYNNAKSYADTKSNAALASAKTYTDDRVEGKQDALIAGEGITIIDNVISSTGGGGSSGGSEVTGVKNKIAYYTIVNGASLQVRTVNDVLYEASLADLPIESGDEIISIRIQYSLFGKTYHTVLSYFQGRDDGEYNRYISSSEMFSFTNTSDYIYNGYSVPEGADSIQVVGEIPPIVFYVYKNVEGVLTFKCRFIRQNSGIAFGYTAADYESVIVPAQVPQLGSAAIGIPSLTFTRIDIHYLAAEIQSESGGDDYPTETTLYGVYFDMEDNSGHLYVTAPVGFTSPDELQQWLIDCGYTSLLACPVSECYYMEEYMENAVIYADANGIYVQDAVAGWGGMLESIYDFYDSNQP